MKGVTVQELLDDRVYGLELEVVSGFRGLSRNIYNPRIQKLGLVITGHMVYLHPHRVQILGNSEITYLRSLSEEDNKRIIWDLCTHDVVCFVVTRSLKVPEYLRSETEENGIPLLRSKLVTSVFIERVTKLLEEKLAPSTTVHGVLMDVMGVGILIVGRPGIGKSENALELITRGHRLVVDDVVHVKKMGAVDLFGEAPSMIKNLLEIRGIGIVDVGHLFGVSAVRGLKKINLVVELVDWDEKIEYERVGLKEEKYRLLGIDLPLVRIPLSSGRNTAAIIELACRDHILKQQGIFTAAELEEKILKSMEGRSKA
ncbi:HPr(Ser) kinase/phosphatase [Syntrophorhabdus aromaticivorans]|uniref:HPr kinase/phosphorylase n=1 Tax=Syntrophorhabdus aromaticivorans TaxID=328301 RepID=A0A351U3L6_9BACT|nr:HPr(Ser) kinase/phosphatase [Syntrophorhabdus aromaticivorans]NLW34035.1 HPr(Ser) kinase/phosphatase [Syntrophorhabdus aromaticivorans]HBA54547.1 HPr(Ser) kinase/phosphatase [Syntrophorhabdus aromaticivorans]